MAKFKYYNNNPHNVKTEDCVIRAITLASGLPYYKVREKLELVAKLYECEELCMCCYRMFIEQILKGIPIKCEGLTIGQFADKYPKGVYLLRVDGHLNCVIDNVCYDIFDCRNMKVTDAWRIY